MERRVKQLVEHTRLNLHRRLTLKELAGEVGLSSSRLEHLVKGETGVAVRDLVKRLRLEKAKELLARGVLVKQEARALGYKQTSHFVRDFKHVYKITPGHYRAEQRRFKLEDSAGDEPTQEAADKRKK